MKFDNFVAVKVHENDTFRSLAKKYLHEPSLGWLIADFNQISRLVPGDIIFIPLRPYKLGGLTSRGYQVVPVLCYHKFSKSKVDKMTVSKKSFERQMKFLKQNGYSVITLDHFYDFLNFKAPLPPKSLIITIDDGWRSTYEIAYPILKKYGFSATLFVYTNLITGGSTTLDWKLVKLMYKNGINIECHTKTHPSLTWKSNGQSFKEYLDFLISELSDSKKILEEKLNKRIEYLAYPYGDTDQLVIQVLKKLGYKGAFTVSRDGNGFFVNPYRIHRTMVYGNWDLTEFKQALVTQKKY